MLVFSTHAFTEGDWREPWQSGLITISTHAFTEGDGRQHMPPMFPSHFNSRLRGRRLYSHFTPSASVSFQLTPSRKATLPAKNMVHKSCNFNSRLRGRRRKKPLAEATQKHFNSRLRGRRPICVCDNCSCPYFNSRLRGRRQWRCAVPVSVEISTRGRRRNRISASINDEEISTHAFAEGDVLRVIVSTVDENFNSRLRGRRRILACRSSVFCSISTHAFAEGDSRWRSQFLTVAIFQLTPSRKATHKCVISPRCGDISTHAFAEGDRSHRGSGMEREFQLTPSRKATIVDFFLVLFQNISTHAFAEGDTRSAGMVQSAVKISTHAFAEGDSKFK